MGIKNSILETIGSGNIVVLFPDRAEKYLSTVMFDPFNE